MQLSLEEKTNLTRLSARASDLLVDIIDDDLPSLRQPTEHDLEFKDVLSQIYHICPLLSDSYTTMYNTIQEQKISADHTYYKRLYKD